MVKFNENRLEESLDGRNSSVKARRTLLHGYISQIVVLGVVIFLPDHHSYLKETALFEIRLKIT